MLLDVAFRSHRQMQAFATWRGASGCMLAEKRNDIGGAAFLSEAEEDREVGLVDLRWDASEHPGEVDSGVP